MQNAVLHGADMIEFDVQLSKDMIPVIYHDFELCLSTATRQNGENHLIEIPLKSLTLEQLHHLRVIKKAENILILYHIILNIIYFIHLVM